jgi:hypothetical protein
VEIIIFSLLKFRFQYSFILFFIYSLCIVSSIWLLELFKVNHLSAAQDQQASVEVFSVIYYAPIQPADGYFLYDKYLWSQIQIQIYVFIIVALKGLSEKRNHRFDIVIKTWTTALDLLDFMTLLDSSKLYSDIRFVYITLSVWSVSCLQFIIRVSTIKRILMKRGYHRLSSLMTDSFVSMIITDIPYLAVRLYVIFGVTKHDYTSYFLVSKNIMVIILQTADVWIAFHETTSKKTKPTSV